MANRCRYCGKPIPKRTRTVHFGATEFQLANSATSYSSYNTARPTSKAEAQRLVNQQVVSVRWARGEDYGARQAGFDHITQVTTWDGESYENPFFCNGTHAHAFAAAAVRAGYTMKAYDDAVAKDAD